MSTRDVARHASKGDDRLRCVIEACFAIKKDRGQITATKVGRYFGIPRSTVHDKLKLMVSRGLIAPGRIDRGNLVYDSATVSVPLESALHGITPPKRRVEGARYFLKSTGNGMQTTLGFRWPPRGQVEVEVQGLAPENKETTPIVYGDGLGASKSVSHASAYYSENLVVVSVLPEHILAEDDLGVRFSKGTVVCPFHLNASNWAPICDDVFLFHNPSSLRLNTTTVCNMTMYGDQELNLDCCGVQSCDFTRTSIVMSVRRSIIRCSTFIHSRIRYSNISKATFDACLFAYATITNSQFVNCSLTSCVMDGAIIKNTLFNKCDLGGSKFQAALIDKVSWDSLVACGADLTGAHLLEEEGAGDVSN